jgi:signal transduction histidine kinase
MPDEPTVALPIVEDRRRSRWRDTFTARAVAVGCAVALISVIVTALIAIPLAARDVDRENQESLARETQLLAAAVRGRIGTGRPRDEGRIVAQLRAARVDAYLIREGVAEPPGLPDDVVAQIAAGAPVRHRPAVVGGRAAVLEGRPLPGGNGVVLAQPARTGFGLQVWRRLWLPLLAGLAAGVAAGILLARRLSRPIRTAAAAAARLRAGDRGVRLPVEPPAEAADLARAINDLAAALATSEGRQREFLLSVSHELRTPLTTLRGYAEALADGVVGADGSQRAGQTMLAEAEHLDRLVSDLLALARLEAADFAVELAGVELTRLVADAAEAWGARCAAAGVILRTELAGEPVWAYTDAGRIRQVLDGLLENALRIVPAGAEIVLAARAPALVEVRDGGPGFTDADLAVVFERGALYERYRGVRKVGSGLGLALAAGLVRRVGGRIEAGHAGEGGARFTVWLPSAGPPLPNPNVGLTPPSPERGIVGASDPDDREIRT